MLDPKLLRENPDLIREALKRRGMQVSLEELIELDQQRRNELVTIESDRSRLKK